MYCKYKILLLLLCVFCFKIHSQNVSLYQQFNGKYDFTFIGNTLNSGENNLNGTLCEELILPSSSAMLNLNSNDTIIKAYLYWAGSGTGDNSVTLNNTNLIADRLITTTVSSNNLAYFCGFKDITTLIQSQGNTTYTLSNLDILPALQQEPLYCSRRTNFSGWAIVVIYENSSLPINQINVYDGLQGVPNDLTINLNSLNVIDTNDAKIGFIAWEGDSELDINETLTFNENVLSNPPLNPPTNAFNGTNSILETNTLYNMDLDIYDIQNYINIGDTTAAIKLTSGQDVVLISTVVTKLNSQLPDATTTINSVTQTCNSQNYTVDFTIFNTNATANLPINTPISFYADNQLVAQTNTSQTISVNGSWNSAITIQIPATITTAFTLKIIVDSAGIIPELIETNNDFSVLMQPWLSPIIDNLPELFVCKEKTGIHTYDFSAYPQLATTDTNSEFIGFYLSEIEAALENNAILNNSNFITNTVPKTIFIRVENEHCYSISQFILNTKICELETIPNFIDTALGNTFHIEGLRELFPNFEITIFNRWGKTVWTGTINTEEFSGKANSQWTLGNTNLPVGTYFYHIAFNDGITKPKTGWIFVN